MGPDLRITQRRDGQPAPTGLDHPSKLTNPNDHSTPRHFMMALVARRICHRMGWRSNHAETRGQGQPIPRRLMTATTKKAADLLSKRHDSLDELDDGPRNERRDIDRCCRFRFAPTLGRTLGSMSRSPDGQRQAPDTRPPPGPYRCRSVGNPPTSPVPRSAGL